MRRHPEECAHPESARYYIAGPHPWVEWCRDCGSVRGWAPLGWRGGDWVAPDGAYPSEDT